ncbi:hypothetical protein [Mycolicibacterium porcinum]|uniref:DUF4381 domain-containing protein n=1 Tax=Mycolicibacterium porcinum TaxID=39693 RepID=A0AAW5T0P7_9MYCO|nr:hypothetical protein [Mycolicibacterium porcinum]MCV7387735.1 hypothetical protein [Mycolicibacterium porcinum]
MLVLGGGFVPLSGRSWPDTPQEALARAIFLILLAAVIIPAVYWVCWWFTTNRPMACQRQLAKASAEFRARWPAGQLNCAPYDQLDEEAERCWLLILLLEERQLEATGGDESSIDVAAVRHWLDSVVAALNAAAARDRQAAGAGDSW